MPLQKWSDDIWVCQLSSEPAFSEDVDTLLSRYEASGAPPHVVLDLSEAEVLNSSNLSQMLRVRKLVSDAGRRVKISGPSNAVWTLFLTMGLDQVFDFAQDTATALAELQLGA
ncbi:MAG: STAS domain-containing protein [Planctomycetota bacterium]